MNESTPLLVDAHAEVLAAADQLGRSEDAVFSPDGSRLAIAAYNRSLLAIFDLADEAATAARGSAAGEGDGPVRLTGCTIATNPSLSSPHGVEFVDDMLVVANRHGVVTIHPLPPAADGLVECELPTTFVIDLQDPFRMQYPGSVRARALGDGIHEVVVCNNYIQRLTRHYIDARERCSLRDEIMLTGGALHMPDGLAFSHDGRWLAIASPDIDAVLLYDFSGEFTPATAPITRLHGATHPHGLAFTPDDDYLLVADAGAPFVHTHSRGSGWGLGDGMHTVTRVMNDDDYALFGGSPAEGGPKGLAIHPSGNLVALAAEAHSLRFFATDALLAGQPRPAPSPTQPPRRPLADEIRRGARSADALRARQRAIAERDEVIAECDRKLRVLEQWIVHRFPPGGDQTSGSS